jgi:hypothetical protein
VFGRRQQISPTPGLTVLAGARSRGDRRVRQPLERDGGRLQGGPGAEALPERLRALVECGLLLEQTTHKFMPPGKQLLNARLPFEFGLALSYHMSSPGMHPRFKTSAHISKRLAIFPDTFRHFRIFIIFI